MFIDLSAPVNQNTPVYPGDPSVKIEPAGMLDKDGYQDHVITFGTHVGTHIDAPAHMIEGGITLDQIPVEQFTGRGRLIDATNGDFTAVKDAEIQAGDIVFFRTAMSDHYHESTYFEDYPAMTLDIANYLVEKGVKMVGLDTGSADNQDGFSIHKALLAGGVLIIENLTNIDKLTGCDFNVFALPMNLQLDGAPARVIAEVTED